MRELLGLIFSRQESVLGDVSRHVQYIRNITLQHTRVLSAFCLHQCKPELVVKVKKVIYNVNSSTGTSPVCGAWSSHTPPIAASHAKRGQGAMGYDQAQTTQKNPQTAIPQPDSVQNRARIAPSSAPSASFPASFPAPSTIP